MCTLPRLLVQEHRAIHHGAIPRPTPNVGAENGRSNPPNQPPPTHRFHTEGPMEAEGHKDQSGFTNKQGCHKDGNSKTQIGQEGILLLQENFRRFGEMMKMKISAIATLKTN